MAHHGHGHSHGCGGHGHGGDDHDHDHDSPEIGVQYNLYLKIDKDRVECLNETVEGSGKQVFKPWNERLDKSQYVDSDADEELLFNIPFTGLVKLKGVIIIGGEDEEHPDRMKLFKNREHMTFDDVHVEADQEFELQPDPAGVVEYHTKVVRFSSVHHLSIYFPGNFGADSTRVYYIGLRGEYTEMQRQEVMICNYELAPNPADHKTDVFDPAQHSVY
ncbi:PITH domain-containing protein 1 [Branchiostoma belcheri]|nr:PITH domain-containing protein 1 [Branchiostoma belcheri]